MSAASTLASLFNVENYFRPFSVVDDDAVGFIDSFVSNYKTVGYSMASLFIALRLISFIMNDEERRELSTLAVESVVVLGLIAGYSFFVNAVPEVFNLVGKFIISTLGQEHNSDMAKNLAAIGNEKSSSFAFITGNFFTASIAQTVAAIASIFAILLIAVLSFIQPYIYALMYVIGPLLLPLYLYKPLRDISLTWYKFLLATAFWSPMLGIFLVILTKSLIHALSASLGQEGSFLMCIVLSVIIIWTMAGAAIESYRIFGTYDMSFLAAAAFAATGLSYINKAASVALNVAAPGVGTLGTAAISASKKVKNVIAKSALKAGGKGLQQASNAMKNKALLPGATNKKG